MGLGYSELHKQTLQRFRDWKKRQTWARRLVIEYRHRRLRYYLQSLLALTKTACKYNSTIVRKKLFLYAKLKRYERKGYITEVPIQDLRSTVTEQLRNYRGIRAEIDNVAKAGKNDEFTMEILERGERIYDALLASLREQENYLSGENAKTGMLQPMFKEELRIYDRYTELSKEFSENLQQEIASILNRKGLPRYAITIVYLLVILTLIDRSQHINLNDIEMLTEITVFGTLGTGAIFLHETMLLYNRIAGIRWSRPEF